MPLYKFTIYGASVFYVSCAAAVRTPSFTLEVLEIKSNAKQKPYVSAICKFFFVFRRCIRRHKKAACSDRNRDLSNHSALVSGLGVCWIPFRVVCRPQLPGCRVVRQSCVLVRVSSRRGRFDGFFSAPATAFAGRIRCYRAERGIGRYFFFAKNRYLSGYVFQVLHRVAVVVAAAGVRSGAGDGAAYRPPPRSASRYDPPESGGPETGLALRQRLSQTQGFVAAQRQPAPSGRTAQPASLRQYPFEDDAPCRTAFALPDALRQPRTRYDSQRTGAGREPAVRTLLRPADRRGGHRAGSGVHPPTATGSNARATNCT